MGRVSCISAAKIDERPVTVRGQSWDWEATWIVKNTRVRVRIHRDSSYSEQAWAKAESFHAGWHELTTLPGEDPKVANLPSAYLLEVQRGNTERLRTAARALALDLIYYAEGMGLP